MLPRRAAAEVLPRQQYLGALVARLVEHEVRVRPALGVVHARLPGIQIAPLVEQVGTEAGALDRLQEQIGRASCRESVSQGGHPNTIRKDDERSAQIDHTLVDNIT